VEDCYSTNHYRDGGGNGRSRATTTPTGTTTTWRKKASTKRVTFADPLVQVFGQNSYSHDPSLNLIQRMSSCNASSADWIDPMRDEPLINHMYAGHPSKEQCILAMLDAATGWEPIPSPVAQEGGSPVAAPQVGLHVFPAPVNSETDAVSSTPAPTICIQHNTPLAAAHVSVEAHRGPVQQPFATHRGHRRHRHNGAPGG
jgi:hypothetical protein